MEKPCYSSESIFKTIVSDTHLITFKTSQFDFTIVASEIKRAIKSLIEIYDTSKKNDSVISVNTLIKTSYGDMKLATDIGKDLLFAPYIVFFDNERSYFTVPNEMFEKVLIENSIYDYKSAHQVKLEKSYGIEPYHPKADLLYIIAYREGHSSGDIEHYYDELVELIK